MKRLFLSVAAVAMAIGLAQTAHGLAIAQSAPQASPTQASPAPAVSASPKTRATPAPPKDTDEKRVGISGVWEVQIQTLTDGTVYTHFKLTQSGNTLTGQYLDNSNKKYPLAGSIDGKDVHVVVSLPDGSALVFTGTVDANTDMAGTLNTAKDIVGFTAAYRPKYKWLDNLSPNPGIPGTP